MFSIAFDVNTFHCLTKVLKFMKTFSTYLMNFELNISNTLP